MRNGDRFAKTAFTLDWDAGRLQCPAGVQVPFTPGSTVHFPRRLCRVAAIGSAARPAAQGRSVHIHPDERLLAELRERQQTRGGPCRLARAGRRRAHPGAHRPWQGDRARYRGLRKNLFDLRRMAVVENLHSFSAVPT